MAKLPAFQFYPGDWMKDPELRACSTFARGLLVDLLCLLHEAKSRGRFVWANGEAWTDQEIVNALPGADPLDDRLRALAELLKRGVLKRDSAGIVHSTRMVRDENVRIERSKAGSKGGSKTQAKRKTAPSKTQAKSGSSSSSSSSVSNKRYTYQASLDNEDFRNAFQTFADYVGNETGRPLDEIRASVILQECSRRGAEKATKDLLFSVFVKSTNLKDSDDDFSKRQSNGADRPKRKTQRERKADLAKKLGLNPDGSAPE